MEREISSATWMAISLMALAAFLGIAMWTVYLGNNVKSDAIAYGADLAYSMESGEMNELLNNCEDMPMASIYNIMARNYQNIAEVVVYKFKGSDFAYTLENFEAKQSDGSVSIPGTEKTIWKTNSDGFWTLNGSDTEPDKLLMSYEVIMQEQILNGRGYITINRLPSDTYRVKILFYGNVK